MAWFYDSQWKLDFFFFHTEEPSPCLLTVAQATLQSHNHLLPHAQHSPTPDASPILSPAAYPALSLPCACTATAKRQQQVTHVRIEVCTANAPSLVTAWRPTLVDSVFSLLATHAHANLMEHTIFSPTMSSLTNFPILRLLIQMKEMSGD